MRVKPSGSEHKRALVELLVERMDRYPVVGVLDIAGVPAAQFQRVRKELGDRGEIAVSKKTLIALALQKAGERYPKLEELAASLEGQSALVFTRMNPFELNKLMRGCMVDAPAKPGSVSSTDLVIRAGETDFPPGPIVGELQRVGIKARIQAGRVVVLEDCTLVRASEPITKETADVLAKLGITPVKLGVKLRAAYEGGLIFSGEVLEIDEELVSEQLKVAHAQAFNLALNSGYPTRATLGIMLARAWAAARNLAFNACLLEPEILPALLSHASSQMLALAATLLTRDERALDEDLKSRLPAAAEAKPEEAGGKPKEERKEEEVGLGELFK